MLLTEMYPAINNSIQTTTTASITASSTSITVVDGNVLPPAPNLIVMSVDDNAELIRYGAKSGNTISQCQRGFNGTLAQIWPSGTICYRSFTAYDHDTFINNINYIDSAAAAIGSRTVYVNTDTGDDARLGNSSGQAVKTMARALQLLPLGGVGTLTIAGTAPFNENITFQDQRVIYVNSAFANNGTVAFARGVKVFFNSTVTINTTGTAALNAFYSNSQAEVYVAGALTLTHTVATADAACYGARATTGSVMRLYGAVEIRNYTQGLRLESGAEMSLYATSVIYDRGINTAAVGSCYAEYVNRTCKLTYGHDTIVQRLGGMTGQQVHGLIIGGGSIASNNYGISLQKKSYAIPVTSAEANKWYRIAESGNGLSTALSIATFRVAVPLSNYHTVLEFTAATGMQRAPKLSQTIRAAYSSCISNIRIVYNTATASVAYLEVQYTRSANTAVTAITECISGFGWKLLPVTDGEIPAGYTFIQQSTSLVNEDIPARFQNRTIYVNPETGNDYRDGATANTAVATLARAVELASRGGQTTVTVQGTASFTENLTILEKVQFYISGAVTINGNVSISGGSFLRTSSDLTINSQAADAAVTAFSLLYNATAHITGNLTITHTSPGALNHIGIDVRRYSRLNVTGNVSIVNYARCLSVVNGGQANLHGSTVTYNRGTSTYAAGSCHAEYTATGGQVIYAYNTAVTRTGMTGNTRQGIMWWGGNLPATPAGIQIKGAGVLDVTPSSTANRFWKTGAANSTPTWGQVDLSTDTIGNLPLANIPSSATANRVLRTGTANSTPVWGQVAATTDITGRLPAANMPTSATANRVLHVGTANSDPVYGQVGLTNEVTGILPLANGGTNASTAAAARTNLGGIPTYQQWTSISIPSSAWAQSGTVYTATGTCTGMLATDSPTVKFAQAEALGGVLLSYCEAAANGIKVFANSPLSSTITIPLVYVLRG